LTIDFDIYAETTLTTDIAMIKFLDESGTGACRGLMMPGANT